MTKYINYLLILFAFSLPFKAFPINVIPELVFVLWLIEGDLVQKWHILKAQKIFWVLSGISIILLLSITWSHSIYDGFYSSSKNDALHHWFGKYGYKLLILPVLLTNVNKTVFKNAMTAFLLGMLIAEIVSYGIFFQLWEIGIGTPMDPAPFMHHTYYSTFLVFTIFVLFIRFHREKNRTLKLFYLFFAISATINLFINGGRTGQFAFLLSALYFTLHHYRLTFKSIAITLVSVFTIYIAAYNVSPVFKHRMNYTKESLEKLSNHQLQTSFGQRVAIWIMAKDVIIKHPILGVGIGDAKKAIHTVQEEKYPDRAYIKTLPHIHNQFLQTYVESGVIGFGLLVMIFYLLFKENFYEFDTYAKIFGISLLILFFVDTPYRFSIGSAYLLFFIGLLFGYKRSAQERI